MREIKVSKSWESEGAKAVFTAMVVNGNVTNPSLAIEKDGITKQLDQAAMAGWNTKNMDYLAFKAFVDFMKPKHDWI